MVFLHADCQLLGAVAVHDPLRPESLWVVEYMQKLGLDVWLCSGDNTATAEAVAGQLGIRNVVAEALPGTKSDCVGKLKHTTAKPRRVCFVGDGVNDSPALAEADVGIAIGVGAQVAIDAADVTLVRAEISDVAAFIALSKAAFRTILLNFFWAFCFNFVCLPLAAGMFYPTVHISPLLAGVCMASSSCLVVFTSLRLRFFRRPTGSVSGADTQRLIGRAPRATLLGSSDC